MERKLHEPVRNMPVAKFYYKGTHSHPVRRTVLVIESKPGYIRGYELREGSRTRRLANAPVKSYNRGKIAKKSQLGKNKHKEPGPNETTLSRDNLFGLILGGI